MSAALLAAEEGSRDVGVLPLLVVLLLVTATVLLIRNMSSRIRRLPPSFPDQDTHTDTDRDDRPEPPAQP